MPHDQNKNRISIDIEKSFDKMINGHPITIKTQQRGYKENILQHKKDHIRQTHSLHHIQP